MTAKLITPIFLLLSLQLRAQTPEFNTEYDSAAIAQFLDSMTVFYDSVEASIKYQHGEISIANNTATLRTTQHFKFIDAFQSRYIMTELYGNPEDTSIIGILMPEQLGVTYGEGFMFVLYYRETGFIRTTEDREIDADGILATLRKASLDENKSRIANHLETYAIIGWARQPRYDATHHLLTWAKELKFDSDVETNTLNYTISLLGRKGVITLNAIATMRDLLQIDSARNQIPGMIEFNKGYGYTEFDAQTDGVSSLTLTSLISGPVLVEQDGAINTKQFILIAIPVAGLILFLFIYFNRKKKKQEDNPV